MIGSLYGNLRRVLNLLHNHDFCHTPIAYNEMDNRNFFPDWATVKKWDF